MLRALDGLGIARWTLDVGPPVAADPGARRRSAVRDLPPPGAPLVLHVNPPMLPLALLRLPRSLVRGRRVIGYWAWELGVPPGDWVRGAGFVHEAWVPSAFTAAAVETLLPGRVRVVPHALALAPPLPSRLGRADFGLPEAAVVVLASFSLASSFERKNPMGSIAAFRAAFGERPDRLLVLKIGQPEHFPDDFATLRAAIADVPNIRLETRLLTQADSHALTRAADIVLSLHRAEGFGLVPAEAMLLGVPVIATGWSGNLEFMDQDCAALTGYRLIPARDPRAVYDVAGAVWAEPDQADAVAHLRRLAEDRAVRAQLGPAGQAAARARLGAAPLEAALRAIGLARPGPGAGTGRAAGSGSLPVFTAGPGA